MPGTNGEETMRVVVAAVIERADRRILIGQRRKADSSASNGNFPAAKMKKANA